MRIGRTPSRVAGFAPTAAAAREVVAVRVTSRRHFTCSDGAGSGGRPDTAQVTRVVARLLLAQAQCGTDRVEHTVRHRRVQTGAVGRVGYIGWKSNPEVEVMVVVVGVGGKTNNMGQQRFTRDVDRGGCLWRRHVF